MVNLKQVSRQTHSSHSNTLPLTVPFTPHTLACIKTRLSVASLSKEPPPSLGHLTKSHPISELGASIGSHTTPGKRQEENAAILIPFCNVDGDPGILLEVRGKLRTHSGEVRCV